MTRRAARALTTLQYTTQCRNAQDSTAQQNSRESVRIRVRVSLSVRGGEQSVSAPSATSIIPICYIAHRSIANAFTSLSPSRSRRRRRRRRKTFRTVRGYSTLRYSTTRHMTLGYTLYGSRRAHSHTLLKSSLMLSTHLLLLFSSLWIAATYSTVTKQSRAALARTHALGATLRTAESFPASAARRDRHL